METIRLELSEYDNFCKVAERFNVKFKVKFYQSHCLVTAPRDKLLDWGYLEE